MPTLNAVLIEIRANLPTCRCKWLTIVPDMDLDNKWVQFSATGKVTLLSNKVKGAVQVKAGQYDAEKHIVILQMKDDSEHRMLAGTGEAE